MATKGISHFQVTTKQFPAGVQVRAVVAGVDMNEFVDKFNNYIDYYNKFTQKQNQSQAQGYWLACATAILSLVVTLLS